MKSFREVSRLLNLIVISLVVVLKDRIDAVLSRLHADQYAVIAILLIAVIGLYVAERAAAFAIDHMRWLRRILAGPNDIEGDWVNIVLNTADPKNIIYAEYCRMRYSRGSYVLSGDTWTVDGKWTGEFSTSGSSYQGRTLEYYYKTGLSRVGGFGVIIYTPNDSLPSDFICRYIDEELGAPHIARGQRVSRDHSEVPMQARKAAALRFVQEFDKNGLLDLEALLKKKLSP